MINFLSINRKKLNESDEDALKWADDAIKDLPLFTATQENNVPIHAPAKQSWIDSIMEWNESDLSKGGTKILQMGGTFGPVYRLKFYLERGGYVVLGGSQISYMVNDINELTTAWDDDKGAWDMVKKFLLSLQVRIPINESEEDELEWAQDIVNSPIKDVIEGQYYRVNNDMSDEPFYYTIDIFVKEIKENLVIYDSFCDSDVPHEMEDDNKINERISYEHAKKLVRTGYWIPIVKERSLFSKENLHESEDDGLEWAHEAVNDEVYKWGDIKKHLNDGDIVSISGDLCDGEGNVDTTLKDEPFIIRVGAWGTRYIRWSRDISDRPSGWIGPTDTSKDWVEMAQGTEEWDDKLNVKILKKEEYPF